MKQLLILLFTLISCSIFAQDSSSVFYKNQVGIDILPVFIGITSSESSPFERIELTYRRAFSPKYYGDFRLEVSNNYTANLGLTWRRDTVGMDTISVFSAITTSHFATLSFVFSRKYAYKRVNLYPGISVSIGGVKAIEQSNQLITPNPSMVEVIYKKDRIIPQISYGLELGVEIPIYQRFSIMLNIHTMLNHYIGDWNYMNKDGGMVKSSLTSPYYEFLRLSNLMVLYKF